MDKFERILEVPACYIRREVANRIAQRIRQIAEEQADADYVQTLRQMAPSWGLTPDQAVAQYSATAFMRLALRLRKDSATFISPSGNVQYSGRDVIYDEIPSDPDQVNISVPGVEGKYLSISMTTDLLQTFPLHAVNKILVQGSDRAWVNNFYQELSTMLEESKKVVRNVVYRWLRPFAVPGFLALSFLEFRLYQLINPDFTLQTPLSGLAIVLVFVLLSLNQYLVFTVGGRATRYLYPYFEFEDRLSERRKDLRKWWITTVLAIHGGGVWAIVTLVWGA